MLSQLLYTAGHALISSYARLMLDMDVRWHSDLPEGPVLFAVNHPSTTDAIFIHLITARPMSVMISQSVFSIPALGAYMRKMGQIEVLYGKGEQVLARAHATLKSGRAVTIFPEGAVSPLEGFTPARSGVARLALSSGAPVVPVGIYLLDENCRHIPTTLAGKPEVITWYLRGPYAITVGRPLYFRGDVSDRSLVRAVAGTVMERIRTLSLESKQRVGLHVPLRSPGYLGVLD